MQRIQCRDQTPDIVPEDLVITLAQYSINHDKSVAQTMESRPETPNSESEEDEEN